MNGGGEFTRPIECIGFPYNSNDSFGRSGSGGANSEAYGWVAARVGAGIVFTPVGGSLGLTATPYAQLGYTADNGPRLGAGLTIAFSVERWSDPEPSSYSAPATYALR